MKDNFVPSRHMFLGENMWNLLWRNMLTAAQTTNLYTQIYIQMGQNIYFGVTQFFFFGFTQSEKCQFWAFVKRITHKWMKLIGYLEETEVSFRPGKYKMS